MGVPSCLPVISLFTGTDRRAVENYIAFFLRQKVSPKRSWLNAQRIRMYAIYGNIYHQYTPNVSIPIGSMVLAYLPTKLGRMFGVNVGSYGMVMMDPNSSWEAVEAPNHTPKLPQALPRTYLELLGSIGSIYIWSSTRKSWFLLLMFVQHLKANKKDINIYTNYLSKVGDATLDQF